MKTFAPVFLAVGIFSLATAQDYPVVTPDDVDKDTRAGWCTQQIAMCPNLCFDQSQVDADVNECNPDELTYKCICLDGSSPNLTEYTLTMPFFLCSKSKEMCKDNCKGEQNCANACFTGKECGAKNPKRINTTSTTTLLSPTASGTASSTASGTGTHTGNPFDTSIAATIESWGSAYGVAVMIIGMAAGFVGML